MLHCLADGVLRGAALQAVTDDLIGDRFGVGSPVEDRAGQLKAASQIKGIGEVAVVDKRKIALDVADDERLDVIPVVPAGGGIAHMPDGHLTAAK